MHPLLPSTFDSLSNTSSVLNGETITLVFPNDERILVHRKAFDNKSKTISEWIRMNTNATELLIDNVDICIMRVIVEWVYAGTINSLAKLAKLTIRFQVPDDEPRNQRITREDQLQLYDIMNSVSKTREGKLFNTQIKFPTPDDAETYTGMVTNHVTISIIKGNLLELRNPVYETFADFEEDVDRIYENMKYVFGPGYRLTLFAGSLRHLILERLGDEVKKLQTTPPPKIDNEKYAILLMRLYQTAIDNEVPGLYNLCMSKLTQHHHLHQTFPPLSQYSFAFLKLGELPRENKLHKYLAHCFVYGEVYPIERKGKTNAQLENMCASVPGMAQSVFAAMRGTNGRVMADPRWCWPCEYHEHKEGEWCEVSKRSHVSTSGLGGNRWFPQA